MFDLTSAINTAKETNASLERLRIEEIIEKRRLKIANELLRLQDKVKSCIPFAAHSSIVLSQSFSSSGCSVEINVRGKHRILQSLIVAFEGENADRFGVSYFYNSNWHCKSCEYRDLWHTILYCLGSATPDPEPVDPVDVSTERVISL